MNGTFIAGIREIFLEYWPSFLLGIRFTLLLSILGTIFGLLIGLAVGGFRAVRIDHTASDALKRTKKVFDALTTAYIDIFRGTPMMVQALFLYYAFLNVFHWDKVTAGIVVISVNTGAYMAEIVRSGIQAVDKGQTEAARSLGFSNSQTMINVILPQAIRNIFPAIGNELIVNIKDSSVLMILSITDLMFQSKSIAGSTFKFTVVYFITAVIYFILTKTAAVIMNILEKRLNLPHASIPQSDTDASSMNIGGETHV